MNKKGITLVELLAVITIMALLLLVVLPSVTTLSKKASEQQYKQTVALLEIAAQTYVEQINSIGLNNVGDVKEITLEQLFKAGLIDEPFINPKTKKEVESHEIIKIVKIDINKYDFFLPL